MAFQPANLALDGGDARESYIAGDRGYDVVALHLYNNPDVLFEEYYHYAQITRAEEHHDAIAQKKPFTLKGMFKNRFSSNRLEVIDRRATPPQRPSNFDGGIGDNELIGDEKRVIGHGRDSEATITQTGDHGRDKRQSDMMAVTDSEWKQASRAIRTASWSACFYLITTDILGPFSVPWAFSQMGYGPGIALYTVFAAMAGLSGYYIWKVFLALDSDRYPLRDYGIAFYRIFGPKTRHAVNVLQAVQMILTVSALILSNGQAISQVSQVTSPDNTICFVVCLIIFMVLGMILGQIRTLQRFGWLANFAIWINVLILIFTMAVVARSGPYYQAVMSAYSNLDFTLPIQTFAGTPPAGLASGGEGFIGSLNGLNQAVYSYGGAMLFFSFLSEMRHPWDFWKAMVCANVFIYACYLFFGLFVYSYLGQYTYNPANQGIGDTAWRTATNIMAIVTGLIAACLYGNIGIKVVYTNVLQELFHAPPLNMKAGKWAWVAIVPVYWALAFIVAAAIPQFSYITGLIGAVCILSFTYTFPALLAIGFFIQKDAMLPEESFNPATGRYQRIDEGWKRWMRGYMVKWHLNTFNVIYFLGALATCALGIYSSVEGLIEAFSGASVATSFSCASPA